MSEITVSYNASTGSNTAASGAGPATAVTGTSAAYSGDGAGGGTQTVITFTNTPDLSGVAVDDVLYLNVSAGETYLFEITAVDDGADTVTVDVAPDTAINSGSAVSYAIGGKRAGPRRSGTENDFAMARNGWTFSLDDGTYDLTLNAASGTLQCPSVSGTADTSGLRSYVIRASSMPVDADNCGVIFTFDMSTMDGSGEKMDFYGSWQCLGVEWKPDATAGSTSGPFAFRNWSWYRCKLNATQLTSSSWYYDVVGDGTVFRIMLDCVLEGPVLTDSNSHNFQAYVHCVIRAGAIIFGTTRGQVRGGVVLFCTFEGNDEVRLRFAAGGVVMYGNTFFNSATGNDHVDAAAASSFNSFGAIIINNAFIDAAAYGITMPSNPASDGVNGWHWVQPEFRDYNHFDGNTSGNYNPTTSATTNQGSGAPGFVSETGTIDLRPDTGSALLNAGKNPDIVGDT